MPQRRPHRKSRYGCDQCRSRRVKCDENPPRCSNCISRDEDCHWSRLPPRDKPQSPHSGSCTSHNTPGSGNEFSKETPIYNSTRLRELELMHTWCTRTYLTAGPQWERLFRDYIGKEALQYDYLLAAVFAVTSYHIAIDALVEDLPIARQHAKAGLQYQTSALSGLRTNVGALNADNCSAVLFTSILIGVCAVLSPLLPVRSSESTPSTAEVFLPLADYMQAVESIKGLTLPWLARTSIGKFLDPEREPSQAPKPLFISELHRLNDVVVLDENHEIFHKAINDLEEASRKEDTAVPWLVNVGSKFLDELRKDQSMALAIYMHWGALLDHLNDVWWARFSSPRLVAELSAKLLARGPEWDAISTWCRKQVGLAGESGDKMNE